MLLLGGREQKRSARCYFSAMSTCDEMKPALVEFGATTIVHFEPRRIAGAIVREAEMTSDSPDDFFGATQQHAPRSPAAFDGVPVLDKRSALRTKIGVDLAFKGPSVAVERRADSLLPLRSGVPRISKGCKLPRGEPTLGLSQYLDLWQAVGARVGVFRGGHIEWKAQPAPKRKPNHDLASAVAAPRAFERAPKFTASKSPRRSR